MKSPILRAMHRLLPFCLILGLLITFRALGSALPENQPNFQPLAALFFCGAWWIAGWRGFAVPAIAWLATYPLPAVFQGNAQFLSPGVLVVTFLAFAVTFLLGRAMAEKPAPLMLGGAVVAALVFHLITNGAAWLGSPMYPKSVLGLWQSVWAGPPGSPIPSWMFLRNMMAANLLFTAIFLLARHRFTLRAPRAVRLTGAR
jgi:hypothetical protein